MAIAVSVNQGTARYSRKASAALWTAQALLAMVFLFAGAFKLTAPWEEMAAQMPVALPELFIRFIAACEMLGALGLILPGLTRVARYLTPVAAAGLLAIMVGATTITVATMDVPSALLPFVCGVLAVVVARGRASWLADR
jgi:uncharacterized membrane protein YphA (DoxX/SURF4 family)